MPKYAPLATFLRRQKQTTVTLTFRDIERIVGALLPKAATADGWWREGPSGPSAPQHIALAEAGFVAEPQVRGEVVRFVGSPQSRVVLTDVEPNPKVLGDRTAPGDAGDDRLASMRVVGALKRRRV